MHYRWYSVAVVGLWLTTMGWLVVKKVVPAFRIGSPPSYDEIVKDQIKAAPVGWRMSGGTAFGLGPDGHETTGDPTERRSAVAFISTWR